MAAEPEKNPNEDDAGAASAERESEPQSGASGKGEPNTDEGSDGEGAPAENRRARRAAAARARKDRLRERREAEAVGLDAQEMFDDALVRSRDKAGKWLRRNSGLLQWALVIGIVGWAGWGGYGLFMAKAKADASDAVARAIASERGRIGDPEDADEPNAAGIVDPTPVFEDDAARLSAAREAFEKATQLREGSGTALYAQLALAAVLFDQGKLDEAKQHFETVLAGDLARSDRELKGRASEGIALVLEAKGDKEGALARYGELASGADGFAANAHLHQARLQHELGRTEEAKATLRKVADTIKAEKSDSPAPSFLRRRVEDLARLIAPEIAEELAQPPQLSPERLKELQEQMQKAIAQSATAKPSAPSSTAAPPAPEAAGAKAPTAEGTAPAPAPTAEETAPAPAPTAEETAPTAP